MAETRHPKIQVARNPNADLSQLHLEQSLTRLREALARCDDRAMLAELERILPHWRRSDGSAGAAASKAC